MALLRLAFFPGANLAHWQAVRNAVSAVPSPEMRCAFAAGPVDAGWQVRQLWDTSEDLDGFNRDAFLPAMTKLGSQGFPIRP